jgi:hypothetical protein
MVLCYSSGSTSGRMQGEGERVGEGEEPVLILSMTRGADGGGPACRRVSNKRLVLQGGPPGNFSGSLILGRLITGCCGLAVAVAAAAAAAAVAAAAAAADAVAAAAGGCCTLPGFLSGHSGDPTIFCREGCLEGGGGGSTHSLLQKNFDNFLNRVSAVIGHVDPQNGFMRLVR